MTVNEMTNQIESIEKSIDELRTELLKDKELCSIDNGKCINFILNELDRAKLHLDNIKG